MDRRRDGTGMESFRGYDDGFNGGREPVYGGGGGAFGDPSRGKLQRGLVRSSSSRSLIEAMQAARSQSKTRSRIGIRGTKKLARGKSSRSGKRRELQKSHRVQGRSKSRAMRSRRNDSDDEEGQSRRRRTTSRRRGASAHALRSKSGRSRRSRR
jgi:hypothetical protein